DDVGIPDLLRERARHQRSSPRAGAPPDPRCGRLASRNPRRQQRTMDNSSGVGVLDKTVAVLNALEAAPASLAGLLAATGRARPTARWLALAPERHRVLTRDRQGRFVLGPRLAELAAAAGEDRLLAVAQPVLAQLRDMTGESAQLYRRQGDARICVAAA